MTSTARRLANRRNAQKSTGPRSKEGRARVAANALRHGLAIAVCMDAAAKRDLEFLALKIAGENADPRRMACARQIAEAQIDVRRVRQARLNLLSDPIARSKKTGVRAMQRLVKQRMKQPGRTVDDIIAELRPIGAGYPPAGTAPPTLAEGIGEIALRLSRLDRYERRALSRRKMAIRAFDDLVLARTSGETGGIDG